MSIEKLAALIRERNAIDDEIAKIIERPAQIGHVGEWLAQEIFGVQLERSATQPGYDGRFTSGALSGKTVNVKWYAKREGILDINEAHFPDYYLIFAGPKVPAASSRGTTRPWLISEIFLFDAAALADRLRARGVKLGVGGSVWQGEWDAARIYPSLSARAVMQLTTDQIRRISLFSEQCP